VLVKEAQKLIAIAPLMISPWEGFRHLGLIGSGTADYEDFIVEAGQDHASVCRQILATVESRGGWDFFQFNRFREDSATFQSLQDILAASPWMKSVSYPFAVAPYIAINGSWDDFWLGLKRVFRKDSERRIRRLVESEGLLEYRSPSSSSEVRHFFNTLVEQHLCRRRDMKNDYSLFEDSRLVDFYADLAQQLHQSGTLDLTAMCLGPKFLAIHFGARYSGIYYYLFPTFDAEYSKFAVGRILLHHLLRQSFDNHMQEFDMLYGDEAYKFEYTSHTHRLFSLAIYHYSIRGKLAYLWFACLRRHLRKMRVRQRLIPYLRRARLLRRFS
jgi:CelD/BcsL family acetyltransferase involved in cellulose biosynthesis